MCTLKDYDTTSEKKVKFHEKWLLKIIIWASTYY